MKINHKTILGIFLTLGYLVINLLVINDYPVSWDYHYHYYGGLYHLGLKVPSANEPSAIPFTPPDPRLTVEDPFGPLMSVLPVLSQIIFHDKLGILPFDSAYNLFSVIIGSLGVSLIYFFLLESFGWIEAILGAFFLALLPVHFGYLHTNMKDVPSAFFFALTVYLFWRGVKFKKISNLLLAAFSFGIAFNIKINAVFIPLILFPWLITIKERKVFKNYLFFIIAPIFALLIWFPFWKNPVGKLLELIPAFSRNTLGMPVLLSGNIYQSGVNVPWYYSWIYILITTPPVILFSFLISIVLFILNRKKINFVYLLFLIWFMVPLLRYISPKTGIIDGVRHFLEVVYPLCAIAAVGIGAVLRKIRIIVIKVIIIIIIISGLAINIIKFHPYETNYFNFLVGGIKGAQGKYDIDFWGTPQREAVYYLNKNVPTGSYINIAMDQASTGIYLREDLLSNLNIKSLEDSDYKMILNRQSFFNSEIKKILKSQEDKIIYTRKIDGVPLVWVIKK